MKGRILCQEKKQSKAEKQKTSQKPWKVNPQLPLWLSSVRTRKSVETGEKDGNLRGDSFNIDTCFVLRTFRVTKM